MKAAGARAAATSRSRQRDARSGSGCVVGSVARLVGREVQPHFGAKMRKELAVGGSASNFDDVYDGFIDEWALERSPGFRSHAG